MLKRGLLSTVDGILLRCIGLLLPPALCWCLREEEELVMVLGVYHEINPWILRLLWYIMDVNGIVARTQS